MHESFFALFSYSPNPGSCLSTAYRGHRASNPCSESMRNHVESVNQRRIQSLGGVLFDPISSAVAMVVAFSCYQRTIISRNFSAQTSRLGQGKPVRMSTYSGCRISSAPPPRPSPGANILRLARPQAYDVVDPRRQSGAARILPGGRPGDAPGPRGRRGGES